MHKIVSSSMPFGIENIHGSVGYVFLGVEAGVEAKILMVLYRRKR
jgi:hypothetical protein